MEEKLGRILERIIKDVGLSRRLNEAKVISLWDCEVGPDLPRFTRALRVHRGILYVVVANSVWAHELTFLKRELAGRLNSCIGGTIVRDIRFLVGREDTIWSRTPTVANAENVDLEAKLESSTQETDQAAPSRGGTCTLPPDIGNGISDPVLRRVFRRAMGAAVRAQQLKGR